MNFLKVGNLKSFAEYRAGSTVATTAALATALTHASSAPIAGLHAQRGALYGGHSHFCL